MSPIVFKLRKLCSSTEEYEANASGPLDLDVIEQRLSDRQGVELSRQGNILTVLFEDEEIVVRLSSSGRALIQARLRENAEHVCSVLGEVA